LTDHQPAEGTARYGNGSQRPTAPAPVRRVRTQHLREMKERGERFTMLTAYDMYAAQVFDEAGIDVLLIGDSAANNVYGYSTSLPVTVDELLPLARAVARSTNRALVMGELPFGSYQASPEQAYATATRFMKEAGVAARFVRQYADLHGVLLDAARSYATDVKEGSFPSPEHAF
jgi:3-methyl-2-oxobutanoate hydroxymethyltransferase